jgi:type VI protein secretion system component Hcp
MNRKNRLPRVAALPVTLGDDELGVVCGGTGRADFSSLTVMKVVDKASPKLYGACCTGRHYDEAKLVV